MKKKVKTKQVLAIIAIALLVAMYLTAMILAFIKNPLAQRLLQLSLLCTFAVPVLIYLIMMFYKLAHRNDHIKEEEKVYADEKDDPFTEEDFKE